MRDHSKDEHTEQGFKEDSHMESHFGGNSPSDYYTFGESQSDFIREKIVRKTSMKKELLRLLGRPLAGGCLFGLAAALVFVIVTHFFSGLLPESTTVAEETKAETIKETEEEGSMPQNEEELEHFVSAILENGDQEELAFYDNVQTTVKTLENSMVTVVARKKDVDWFAVSYDSQYSQSGVLIKKDSDNYYILAGYKNVRGADSILIKMSDGIQVTASLEGYDTVYDIAVLSISRGDLSASADNTRKVVKIGNTSALSRGMPVFAIGSPSGSEGSVGIGFISYINEQLSLTDCVTRGIQSSVHINGTGCSFLMGVNGELLGIFTGSDQSVSTGYSQAYGINSLMVYVNRILNGETTAGIGITGQDIEESLREENKIPEGVYVTDVKKDSAAYQAGVQTGDVLAELGGKQITSMEEYESLLENLAPDKEVKMIVYRNSKGAYKKMELKITPTVRQG